MRSWLLLTLVCSLVLSTGALGQVGIFEEGFQQLTPENETWYIDDHVTIQEKTRPVSVTITVRPGGELEILDTEMIFTAAGPREVGIHVLPGGLLTVRDSILRPTEYTNNFPMAEWTRWFLWIEGDCMIEDTEVIAPWGGTYEDSNDRGGGIFLKGGTALIDGVTVVDALWGGITVREGTSATIRDSTVTGVPFQMADERGIPIFLNMMGIWLLNFGEAFSTDTVVISGSTVENSFIGINSQCFRADVSDMTFNGVDLIDINVIQGGSCENKPWGGRVEEEVSFWIEGNNKHSSGERNSYISLANRGPLVVLANQTFDTADTGRFENWLKNDTPVHLWNPTGDFRETMGGAASYHASYRADVFVDTSGYDTVSIVGIGKNESADGNTSKDEWVIYPDIPVYEGGRLGIRYVPFMSQNAWTNDTEVRVSSNWTFERVVVRVVDGDRVLEGNIGADSDGEYHVELEEVVEEVDGLPGAGGVGVMISLIIVLSYRRR